MKEKLYLILGSVGIGLASLAITLIIYNVKLAKTNKAQKTNYEVVKVDEPKDTEIKIDERLTDAQKEVISKYSKEKANDGRNMIYCYNLLENSTYIAITLKALNNILNENLKTGDIRNLLCRKKYILARSLQDLESKKILFKNKVSLSNSSTKFVSKLTNEMIKDIKEGMKEKDFLHKHKVCKKTYYNYKNKIL